MNQFVRRMALLGSAILLILALQVLPDWSFRRVTDAERWVEHTLRVQHAVERELTTLEDAETSERGYLLTGDTGYLTSFDSAVTGESDARRNLSQLTADNAAQQVRLAKLYGLVDIRLAWLKKIIGIYGTEGKEAAATAVTTGTGNRVMGEVREITGAIQNEEQRLLGIRTAAVDDQRTLTRWILRAGGVLLICLLIGFAMVSERDIRAHRRSEEALQTSREEFQTLANAIPQLCWIADAGGDIYWYNQRWYDFTGTCLEDMKGWGWQSVHDPATLPGVTERWTRSIALHKPFEMIFPLRAADGSFHTFLTRVMPFFDESGNLIRWFGTNTDISEQQKIEHDLRENQERLRMAQEVARIGTFEWNTQTGRNQRTAELEAMYGQPPGAFDDNKRTWLDCVAPEDQPEVRRQMREAMKTGSFQAEWRLVLPDGQERWHFGRARILKDESGTPLRAIGAIVDVTERNLAQREVLRMNAELEERVRLRTAELETANAELAAFSYSVSHDLRAPLRGIDGWSLALLEDYGALLDDQGRGYLDRVRSETQRMGNLIDDMLQLSRVTRDEMTVDPVNLSSVAQSIAVRLRETVPERHIEFAIEPDLMARGDERLLRIALTNLLSNAVKFTGKRDLARIEFGKTKREGEMAFYVRDNGAGFDMAHSRTLFGAFQRLHKVSEFPGTGIGLAIVQRVVSRHGGRVSAEAEVNAGATFWFTLGLRA